MRTLVTSLSIVVALAGCKKSERPRQAPGPATPTATAPAPGSAPAAPTADSGFLSEFKTDLDFVHKKLTKLAAAIPDAKWGWRAHPETKTLSELFVHIGGAMYMMFKTIGVEPPAKYADPKSLKALTSKQDVMALIEAAYAHARKVADTFKEADLSQTVKAWGKQRSKRFFFLIAMIHQHEHLGQLSAWSRSAGIEPPWITEQKRRQKEKGAKKGPGKKG